MIFVKKEKSFLGCSVTIPYKEKIIPYLDAIDNHAKKIGSINTIINNSGKLKGFNTDYYGSLYSIKKCPMLVGSLVRRILPGY